MRIPRRALLLTLAATFGFGCASLAAAGEGNLVVQGSCKIREAGQPDEHGVTESTASRYTVRTTEQGSVIVDGVTGQTWMLAPYKDGLAWLPAASVDPVERLRQLGAKVTLREGVVKEVDLTDSTIADGDMQVFASLSSLEHLILNGCGRLTDAGLAPLRNLAKLKGLSLERTQITDAGLTHLSDLTELSFLSLNWTRIGDAGLNRLAGLTNLEVLYLCQTETADAGLVSLEKMSKLQWLDLRGTSVTDAGLASLSQLPRLRLLCLYGLRVTDAGAALLSELPNLEVLSLNYTQVTDAALRSLAKSPKLIDLDLAGTHVTQAGAGMLQQALPNCQVRLQAASAAPIEE